MMICFDQRLIELRNLVPCIAFFSLFAHLVRKPLFEFLSGLFGRLDAEWLYLRRVENPAEGKFDRIFG